MLDFDELRLYKQYLNTIQSILDGFFEDQKEYICCQKGCSHCCEKGAYPYSRLEFDYLTLGFMKLEHFEQQEILKRIADLKIEYKKCENKTKFMYRCPFLNSEGCCSLYEFRGLICRTFGLLKPDKNDEIIMPFCQSLGLNYSKVYNREQRMLDEKLIEELNYKNKPKAYPLSFKNLMDENLFEDVKLNFGEIKSLIEWL